MEKSEPKNQSRILFFWNRFKRNRFAVLGIMVVIGYILMAISAPFISPHNPNEGDLSRRLKPPFFLKSGNWRYPLGCDHLGRDILSRIIYGSRISIFIGVAVVAASAAIGTLFGLLAGYYGGRLDGIVCMVVDILLAFPFLIFAIALMAATGPGLGNIILALTYKGWVPFCRVVRGDTLVAKRIEYVEAARAIGASSWRIMLKEILPNVFTPVLVLATLNVATVIIIEASLSFLGLGVQPPTPVWGSMVNEGREYLLSAWWVSTFPGLAILIMVLGVNLFGQGLRDAFDPRLTEEA
ncbi:MAG: ABC transporter permease [Candidatus Poribacteria bacterium]